MLPRHKAYIYLIITIIVWGVAGPVIKDTLKFFDPIDFLTYRFLLSCLILIPLVIITQPHSFKIVNTFSSKDWFILALSGVLGSSVQLGLLFWGMDYTTSIESTLIESASTVLVALAGYYFLKEHLTQREKYGLFIAFFGSILIVLEPLLDTGVAFTRHLFGNIIVMGAQFAWVAYVILTKTQLRHRISPLFLTMTTFVFGFISMSILTFLTKSPGEIVSLFTSAPLQAHLGVIYMATFSGALAYWLYQKASKTIEVSEANIFLYLMPLVATPIGYFWLHEPITLSFVIGSLIIAIGVYLAETKKKRLSQ